MTKLVGPALWYRPQQTLRKVVQSKKTKPSEKCYVKWFHTTVLTKF